MGQSRRTFTDEFKAAAVGRLYKPGATQTGVAKELGVTSSQLKTWRLEIEAADFLMRIVQSRRPQLVPNRTVAAIWAHNRGARQNRHSRRPILERRAQIDV